MLALYLVCLCIFDMAYVCRFLTLRYFLVVAFMVLLLTIVVAYDQANLVVVAHGEHKKLLVAGI